MICGDKERLYARENESLAGPFVVDPGSGTPGGCLMVASANDDGWSIQLVQCGPPRRIPKKPTTIVNSVHPVLRLLQTESSMWSTIVSISVDMKYFLA